MAQRHRLPPAIVSFIAEHHGSMRQDFFYKQAVERHGADQVEEDDFRYRGPRPHSKETGIVMLADACEAAVRAARPPSVQELARLVERIVDDRILEGELDECPLTLHDIAAIKASFVNVLQGVFHPRVQYPQGTLTDQREMRVSGAVANSIPAQDSDGGELTVPAPGDGMAAGRDGGLGD